MRNLLKRLGQMGKTIIVSSHILPELADICNKVGIINRGEMSFNSSITDLMKMVRPQIILAIELSEADRLDEAARTLEEHKLVSSVERNKDRLLVTLGPGIDEYSAIASDLTASRLSPQTLHRARTRSRSRLHGVYAWLGR